MNRKIIVPAAAFSMLAGGALIQPSVVNGAAGGAVTGAVVGGPVGAAVGGVTGAIVGAAIDPPPQKVVTYVQEQPAPTDEVVVLEHVVVGEPLPQTVMVKPIPEDPTYAYAIVNHQRIIIQPKTCGVIQIID